MSDSGVIEPHALERLLAEVGGERAFVTELIDAFIQDAPIQLQNMQRALQSADPEALRRAAHSLKSNSASLGAAYLAALCQGLEGLSREGSLEEAARRLPEAHQEYDKVARALRSLHDSAGT